MPDRIKKILKEYVNCLQEMLNEDLVKVILYGSYARGEQDLDGETSDIDIMILVKTNDEEKIKQILLSPIVESLENYNNKIRYITFYQKVKNEGVVLNG